MTLQEIEEIAQRYSRHVCEAGSPGADRHNRKTIAAAIQEAIIHHERDKQHERDRKAAVMRDSRERRKKLGPGNRSPNVSELPPVSDPSSR